jgi:hypothetical protein
MIKSVQRSTDRLGWGFFCTVCQHEVKGHGGIVYWNDVGDSPVVHRGTCATRVDHQYLFWHDLDMFMLYLTKGSEIDLKTAERQAKVMP